MARVLNRIFESIVKINIEGALVPSTETNIFNLLKQIRPYRLKAMFIIINSFGGSLSVAKNISYGIKRFQQEKKIPIYCFAEQFCLNSANVLLTAGTKSFASKFSLIGDFGYIYQGFDASQFCKRYNVNLQHISNNKLKIQPSILRQSKFTDQKQIKQLLNNAQKDLINQVATNRLNKIQQNNHTEDQFKNKIVQSGIIDPFQAQKYGLIDDITNVENVIYHSFKGMRIIEPQKSIIRQFLKRNQKKVIQFYK